MHYVVGGFVGLTVGVFCPALMKKLKALFAKEAHKGVSLAEAAVQKEVKKL